jgi:hypothetical protein
MFTMLLNTQFVLEHSCLPRGVIVASLILQVRLMNNFKHKEVVRIKGGWNWLSVVSDGGLQCLQC